CGAASQRRRRHHLGSPPAALSFCAPRWLTSQVIALITSLRLSVNIIPGMCVPIACGHVGCCITDIIIYFYVCTADMTQLTRFTFYFGCHIAGMHPYCFTVQRTAIPRIVAYLFSQVNFKGLSLIL